MIRDVIREFDHKLQFNELKTLFKFVSSYFEYMFSVMY